MNAPHAIDLPVQTDWAEANQQLLVAEFAVLRARLAQQGVPTQGASLQAADPPSDFGASQTTPWPPASPTPSRPAPPDALSDALAQRAAARALLPAPAAIDRLTALFDLSGFERDLLLLLAGAEMDAALARALPQVSFATALALLPEPHWSALAPDAPLRAWQLVALGAGDRLTQTPLRIDETVLHALAGVPSLDGRLSALLRPLAPPALLAPEHQAQVEQVMQQLRQLQTQRESCASDTCNHVAPGAPVVQWTGNDPAGRLAAAASLAQRAGLTAWLLPAEDLPSDAQEQDHLARLWRREAALSAALLLIDAGARQGDALQPTRRLVQRLGTAVMVSCDQPLDLPAGPQATIDRPDAGSQLQLWQQALASAAPPGGTRSALAGRQAEPSASLRAMAAQFHLSAEAIWRLATGPGAAPAASDTGPKTDTPSRASASPAGAAPDGQHPLWRASRHAARQGLDDLAQRITPRAQWHDLVLPDAARQQLKALLAQARHRSTVHDDWGFAAQSSRGLGLTALFHGASGVGKTMACEVLAAELDLDLYRIDLAAVVSKYIGETEKNLRQLFNAADASGAILLFDEADALFGQRNEVKDHHDRHANREISDLLQRMEAYRGMAVLTTNLRSAIDPAFARRLRFIVHFPFPDQAARATIWQRVWPAAMPRQALDAERLARLPLSGGQIRNVALNAAFLAAAEAVPVGMGHLAQAARQEAAKGDQPFSEQQLQGWTA